MSKKIAVFGDVILDVLKKGICNRLAQEGPVGIINLKSTTYELGGAACVAQNLKNLGANVELFGQVGFDKSGEKIKELLRKFDIPYQLSDNLDFQTTTKTRIFAENYFVTRVDEENSAPLDDFNELAIRSDLNIQDYSLIIISDYFKGFLKTEFTQWLINLAKENNVFTIVDPKRYWIEKYQNCDLICPNLRELCDLTNLGDSEKSAELLLQKVSNVLVTQGPDGCTLYEQNGDKTHWPSFVKNLVSAVGAGDGICSGIAYGISQGWNLKKSVEFACHKVADAMEREGTIKIS